MTPDAIRQARATLAEMWGLPNPVPAATLGRIIGLTTKNPGQRVLDWERGEPISGPAQFAIKALLDGYKPKTFYFFLRNTRS